MHFFSGKVCSKFAKDGPTPSQVVQKINMKCVEQYSNVCLEWRKIYSLPSKVLRYKIERISVQNLKQILNNKLISSQNWFDCLTIMYFLWIRERVPQEFTDYLFIYQWFLAGLHWLVQKCKYCSRGTFWHR